MSPEIKTPNSLLIARGFAEAVRERNPGRIKSVIFFGSRARGTESADSDYDVCIVVELPDADLEDRIMESAAEWLTRYDAFVSPLVCSETTFSRYREAGIYREILREGIRV